MICAEFSNYFFIEKDLVGLNICKVIIIMYNGKVLERVLTVQFRRVYWSKGFSLDNILLGILKQKCQLGYHQ